MDVSPYIEAWRKRALEDEQRTAEATKRAWEAVDSAVDVLRRRGARQIWLIGSLARGTFEPDSDLDFMVEGLGEQEAWHAASEAARQTGIEVDVVRAEDLDDEWRAYHERYGRKLHG